MYVKGHLSALNWLDIVRPYLDVSARDKHKNKQSNSRTDRGTDTQTGRQTDRQTNRQTDKQTHRQTDRQAEEQTDRQRDRQTERQPAHLHVADFRHILRPGSARQTDRQIDR